jgi:hypothetical protein
MAAAVPVLVGILEVGILGWDILGWGILEVCILGVGILKGSILKMGTGGGTECMYCVVCSVAPCRLKKKRRIGGPRADYLS